MDTRGHKINARSAHMGASPHVQQEEWNILLLNYQL